MSTLKPYFEKSFKTVLEGLLAKNVTIQKSNTRDKINDAIRISVKLHIGQEELGIHQVYISNNSAVAIFDTMMGETQPFMERVVDDDDLDALSEVVSNFYGDIFTKYGFRFEIIDKVIVKSYYLDINDQLDLFLDNIPLNIVIQIDATKEQLKSTESIFLKNPEVIHNNDNAIYYVIDSNAVSKFTLKELQFFLKDNSIIDFCFSNKMGKEPIKINGLLIIKGEQITPRLKIEYTI